MHSYDSYVLAQVIQVEHQQAAKASRLAAVGHAPIPVWRQRLGFGLVEAGLRLAVGKSAHPPRRLDGAGDWSALAR